MNSEKRVSATGEPVAQFNQITESPLNRATEDQLRILHARYAWAAEYAAGKDVLEVACGAGVGLGMIAKVARKVVGGDIDEINCEIARETYKGRPEIEVMRFDAEHIPLPSRSFDLIVLFEALYYFNSAHAFFLEAKRLLRPGGMLLISTVNCKWNRFNRSPFSTRYYAASELAEAIALQGFSVSFRGGFPETENPVIGIFRKAAIWLHLIPKTQKSKEWLKRLFYGRLKDIPREIEANEAPTETLELLAPPYADDHYRFVYCAARLEEHGLVPRQTTAGTEPAAKINLNNSYLVFKGKPNLHENEEPSLPEKLQVRIWGVSLLRPFPYWHLSGLGEEKMLNPLALTLFYIHSMMRGGASIYRIAMARDESRRVCGFAVLRGPDFRFPFMARGDIQFGPVWIAPDYRGRGLATMLCREVLRKLNKPGSNVWWLCKHYNEPSKGTAIRLGLSLVGSVIRKPAFGLPVPHLYSSLDSSSDF